MDESFKERAKTATLLSLIFSLDSEYRTGYVQSRKSTLSFQERADLRKQRKTQRQARRRAK